MLRFAVDENFNNDVMRGVQRRNPAVDMVRVQDAALSGAEEPAILEWAASEGRVLLTHDASTMTHHAYERVWNGQRMPGVFEVSRKVSVRVAIEEILILADCRLENEWEGQVRYLPLR
jgi:hypothetical protein